MYTKANVWAGRVRSGIISLQMLLARCSFGIFCRAVNPSFAQRGAALLVIKGVHERQNSCVFTCFVTLMYTFCCGTPFAAMYLCCGAPFTARSPCSRVLWLPLQPIQSCPRAAFGYNAWCFVPLAQWIRASASGAEGRRFESCKGHQIGQPGLLHAARVFLYESLGALTAVRGNQVSEDFRRGDAMVVPDAVFVRALHGAYNGTLVLRAYRARVWARCMC